MNMHSVVKAAALASLGIGIAASQSLGGANFGLHDGGQNLKEDQGATGPQTSQVKQETPDGQRVLDQLIKQSRVHRHAFRQRVVEWEAEIDWNFEPDWVIATRTPWEDGEDPGIALAARTEVCGCWQNGPSAYIWREIQREGGSIPRVLLISEQSNRGDRHCSLLASRNNRFRGNLIPPGTLVANEVSLPLHRNLGLGHWGAYWAGWEGLLGEPEVVGEEECCGQKCWVVRAQMLRGGQSNTSHAPPILLSIDPIHGIVYRCQTYRKIWPEDAIERVLEAYGAERADLEVHTVPWNQAEYIKSEEFVVTRVDMSLADVPVVVQGERRTLSGYREVMNSVSLSNRSDKAISFERLVGRYSWVSSQDLAELESWLEEGRGE